MTDHQQAAIEAVDDALRADQWDGDPEDLPGSMTREAEIAVEAAEPHLRKKWAEEEAAKLAKTTVGLAAILDRFLENAEWESSGEEMAQKIIESVQNGILKGAGE